MIRILFPLLAAVVCTPCLAADPLYQSIKMEIDVARPAHEVWTRVGKYCDIQDWLKVSCTITSGNGGIGTVRSLDGGRVLEILVGQTDLSYGYTQPAKTGEFYNLYHGFVEARPVTKSTSKLIYTLLIDESDKTDPAARDADIARRQARFESALKEMKAIAESR